LTLFIVGLIPHPTGRPRRTNGATVLRVEKYARTTDCENDGFACHLDFENNIVDGLSVMMLFGANQSWFTQHVEIVRLDDQFAPAAGPAFVAFETIHARRTARSPAVFANCYTHMSNVVVSIR